jgi:hypothetical protein
MSEIKLIIFCQKGIMTDPFGSVSKYYPPSLPIISNTCTGRKKYG